MRKITPIDKEVTFEELGLARRPVISRTDLKGVITFVNKAFEKLTGYSKEELIGQPHSIIRHPDMPKAIFKDLWNSIENNHRWRGFIKNLRKDGRYFWSEVFIESVYDENGIKSGYGAVYKPMSLDDKKKYEEIYREMRKKEKIW
jgi:aerotaxis receptor